MTETTEHNGKGRGAQGRGRGTPEPFADGADGTDPRTLDELYRVVEGLVRVSGRSPKHVSVRLADASIDVEWEQEGAPAAGPGTAVPDAPAGVRSADAPASDGDEQGAPVKDALTITSPLVGTFYHSPEPGAHPFVSVGQDVDAGQQVGIVEAMKLLIPVVSERAGRVTRVLVSNAERVEYDQPLLLLEQEDTA